MGLRDQALYQDNVAEEERRRKRAKTVARVIREAIKYSDQVGIETSAANWKDWGNASPLWVFAEDIEGYQFLYEADRGCDMPATLKWRPYPSIEWIQIRDLAELGRLIRKDEERHAAAVQAGRARGH